MDDKWKKYAAPRPGEPITIDVDKWMAERQNPQGGLVYPGNIPQLPANGSPSEQQAARMAQEELREKWQEREEIASREHLLDNTPRECVECSVTRKHYKDDYMCYRCRDKVE